jgi:hypothetical protein
LYGNGSHSNRVTATPDRAIHCRNASQYIYGMCLISSGAFFFFKGAKSSKVHEVDA